MLVSGDSISLWACESSFGDQKAEERDGKWLGRLVLPRIEEVVLVAEVDRKYGSLEWLSAACGASIMKVRGSS